MIQKKIRTEIVAGLTSFFTMSYLLAVAPGNLASIGVGIPFDGVLTGTVLITFISTLIMGFYGKMPFIIAPGAGVNAFFAYTLLVKNQIPWQIGFGMIFWSGLLYLAVCYSPFRVILSRAIPQNIRYASTVGIGLFLTLIGLRNAGFIVSDPITLVKLGDLNQTVFSVFIALGVMILLHRRNNPFSFLSGIIVVTLWGWLIGKVALPERLWSQPDFTSLIFKMDLKNSLNLMYLPSIFILFVTIFFDSLSGLVGCAYGSGRVDAQKQPLGLKEGLISNGIGSMLAGFFGTTSTTVYLESLAGVQAGGKTGLTAIVTACCFLPFLFLSPIVQFIPIYATAPVLIFIGALMFKNIENISLSKIEDLIPAFLTIALMPLTFSITQGILWGILSHSILYVLVGRRKEVSLFLFAFTLLSFLLLLIDSKPLP